MKNEFGYVHWLGEEDSLHCHRELFSVSSPTEFMFQKLQYISKYFARRIQDSRLNSASLSSYSVVSISYKELYLTPLKHYPILARYMNPFPSLYLLTAWTVKNFLLCLQRIYAWAGCSSKGQTPLQRLVDPLIVSWLTIYFFPSSGQFLRPLEAVLNSFLAFPKERVGKNLKRIKKPASDCWVLAPLAARASIVFRHLGSSGPQAFSRSVGTLKKCCLVPYIDIYRRLCWSVGPGGPAAAFQLTLKQYIQMRELFQGRRSKKNGQWSGGRGAVLMGDN